MIMNKTLIKLITLGVAAAVTSLTQTTLAQPRPAPTVAPPPAAMEKMQSAAYVDTENNAKYDPGIDQVVAQRVTAGEQYNFATTSGHRYKILTAPELRTIAATTNGVLLPKTARAEGIKLITFSTTGDVKHVASPAAPISVGHGMMSKSTYGLEPVRSTRIWVFERQP